MKKLLALLGISILSFMMLIGCGVANEDPPPEDGDVIENGDMNGNDLDNDGLDDPEGDGTNDENRSGDMDMMEDNNTPEEDLIEDADDLRDNDNVDR